MKKEWTETIKINNDITATAELLQKTSAVSI